MCRLLESHWRHVSRRAIGRRDLVGPLDGLDPIMRDFDRHSRRLDCVLGHVVTDSRHEKFDHSRHTESSAVTTCHRDHWPSRPEYLHSWRWSIGSRDGRCSFHEFSWCFHRSQSGDVKVHGKGEPWSGYCKECAKNIDVNGYFGMFGEPRVPMRTLAAQAEPGATHSCTWTVRWTGKLANAWS